MKKWYLYFFVGLSLNSIGQTASNCNCCAEPYRQFDFWLGDWEVFDTVGNKVGENQLIILQDSCAMQENWTSAKGGFTGTSYNYYNAQDKQWRQVWVDNQGGSLQLKGNFNNNKMILRDDLKANNKGVKSYNRITWTPNADGSVRQLWEVFNEKNELKAVLFDGLYRKKKI